MGIVALHDLAAGLRDGLERGLLRKQEHRPARQQNAALIRPARMQIDDRPGQAGRGTGRADGANDLRKRAAVIEMPVRQEHPLDGREVDGEAARVVEPEVGIGADVEEHAVLAPVAPPGDQHGESVAGAA